MLTSPQSGQPGPQHTMYVEFLGIPRERAGTAAVEIEADTLGEVLDVLAVRFPSMAGLVGGRAMHPSVAASLNGDRFVRDPQTRLAAGDRLLLLSADVGG
jgi:molybdopterin converting factor small subunit